MWPTAATDLQVDPLFVNPGGSDYRLQKTSPMIDSGIWVPGRTQDLSNDPISGKAMDRGCYEYQQPNPRDVHTARGRRA